MVLTLFDESLLIHLSHAFAYIEADVTFLRKVNQRFKKGNGVFFCILFVEDPDRSQF